MLDSYLEEEKAIAWLEKIGMRAPLWYDATSVEWREHGFDNFQGCMFALTCCDLALVLKSGKLTTCPRCGKQFRLHGDSTSTVQTREDF